MTPEQVAAMTTGDVVKFTQCADPNCRRRIAATITKSRGVHASCNGRHDPEGLGCGARIFYGHATALRWIADLSGERASDEQGDTGRLASGGGGDAPAQETAKPKRKPGKDAAAGPGEFGFA